MKTDLGPQQGTIQVLTFKEGLLSPLGHDLVIDVGRWKATATVETAEPPAGAIEVECDAGSLVVEGPEELTEKDRNEIQDNVREKVLETKKFAKIRFRSSRIAGAGAGAGKLRVEGTLDLHGVERPIVLEASYEVVGGAARVRGETPLTQTDFRIKPYKAPLGVIKVKNVVRIRWDLRVPLQG